MVGSIFLQHSSVGKCGGIVVLGELDQLANNAKSSFCCNTPYSEGNGDILNGNET
jgi:hypothetical protein